MKLFQRFFWGTVMMACLYIGTVEAQSTETKVWSVADCLQYARDHNVQLKQLGLGVQSAESNLLQSRREMLPNANANLRNGINVGSGIDPSTNNFVTETIRSQQWTVGSTYTLFNGMQRKNTIEQRKVQLALSETDQSVYLNDLDFNILSAYLQILLAEEQLIVLNKQAELTKKSYEQTNKLVRAGLLPAGDLLNMEAQMANDTLNIVNGENAIASAYLVLSQVLDFYGEMEVEKPAVVPPSLSELEGRDPSLIYERALDLQPTIRAAQLRREIAEQDLKIAEGARYPTISLGASMGTNYSSFARQLDETIEPEITQTILFTESLEPIFTLSPSFENTPYLKQLSNNLGYGLSLNVNVPIFNNYRVKNAIAQSKINIENQRYGKAIVANNLRQTIERAYLDARSASQQYVFAQRNVTARQQSLEYAEKRYDLGAINALEYFTAQNNLIAAELQLKQAKYEYIFRVKILDFYEGKPLTDL